MSIGIYKITNIINNKVYIGQSVNIEKRWQQHIRELNKNIHLNNYLQKAWNKYKEKSFKFSIVQICNKEELNNLETYWCNYYKPNVYNLGATGNRKTTSLEKRLKISNTMKKIRKGYKPARTTIENSVKARLGKHLSEETRRKMSLSRKGRASPLKGKHHSIEARAKISEALRRRKRLPLSEETKRKISEKLKGRSSPLKGKIGKNKGKKYKKRRKTYETN